MNRSWTSSSIARTLRCDDAALVAVPLSYSLKNSTSHRQGVAGAQVEARRLAAAAASSKRVTREPARGSCKLGEGVPPARDIRDPAAVRSIGTESELGLDQALTVREISISVWVSSQWMLETNAFERDGRGFRTMEYRAEIPRLKKQAEQLRAELVQRTAEIERSRAALSALEQRRCAAEQELLSITNQLKDGACPRSRSYSLPCRLSHAAGGA